MKIVIFDSEKCELNFIKTLLSEYSFTFVSSRESCVKTISKGGFDLLIDNKQQLENIKLNSCNFSYFVICPKYYQITNSKFNQEHTDISKLLTLTAKIINLLSQESKIISLEEKLKSVEEKFKSI